MNWYIGAFKNYAGFSGRARRTEYWMFFLFNLIAALVLIGIGLAIHFQVLYLIYAIAVIVPGLALLFRRLHDTGKSGWWILITLVPFVGGIVLLVFTVLPGTVGDNQYGPDPKGGVPQAYGNAVA